MVAIIDKIGTIPIAPVDIEKFASSLKGRYQNFQDVNVCDTLVLIVNSRSDRQVFTVAGKDAKLTKEVLKDAFERNLPHFKANHFARGLEGMVEYLTSAYKSAHLETATPAAKKVSPIASVVTPVVVNGVRQIPNEITSPETSLFPQTSTSELTPTSTSPKQVGTNSVSLYVNSDVDESDQLWIDIMKQAVARCGNNQDRIGKYVQAVVEEAMSLSLRLISDRRYTAIEEAVRSAKDDSGVRTKVWQNAKNSFIDEIYRKYTLAIKIGAQQRCPIRADSFRFVSKYWNV